MEECLASLTGSLAKPETCEVIVMDNGSTDGTAAVLDRYAGSPLVRMVRRRKNYGIGAYKKLFNLARGKYVVVVDDDVLAFPESMDTKFEEYLSAYPDYGYLALNVVQNEFTNGAKPGPEAYTEDRRGGLTVERGPTGGWCSCFRARDYRKIKLRFMLTRLDMHTGEDGCISKLYLQRLGLKSGIIRDATCFHASGPYYAKQYGHLDREIAKYKLSGLGSFAEEYERYR